LAYEAANCGLLSADFAAGIRRDFKRHSPSFDQQRWQDLGSWLQPQGYLGRCEAESKGL
jgi:hypothetical protein